MIYGINTVQDELFEEYAINFLLYSLLFIDFTGKYKNSLKSYPLVVLGYRTPCP